MAIQRVPVRKPIIFRNDHNVTFLTFCASDATLFLDNVHHAIYWIYMYVSAEPSVATAWLVSRLERFRAMYPGLDVLIDSSLRLADLEKGAADVAIRFGVALEKGIWPAGFSTSSSVPYAVHR